MFETIITGLFVLMTLLWLRERLNAEKLKRVMRSALRKADEYRPGGRDTVQIPYNQAALLMGWRPDQGSYRFKREVRAHKPDSNKHPSQMSKPERQRLKRGR